VWQMYFCPNCRAQVAYGNRFCRSCGVKLDWLVQQMTPVPASHSQSVEHRNQNQSRWSHTDDNRDAAIQHKNQPIGGVTTPIRTDILKLITKLLDNQN
jgi:hypothetical protein